MDQEHRQRIKWWMAGCLVCTAILVDIIQALLTLVAIGVVLSPIITVGATFLFWIWYMMLGVSFMTNPKRLATFAAESLGELIPAADALPLWTIGTIMTIIITRSEDKGGIIGKAAHVAAPIMQRRAQVTAINRDIKDQIENSGLRSGRDRVGGNTLDLKNKNAQASKKPLVNEQQQKQGDAGQSAGLQQEIQKLKDDIAYAKQEIQRLKTQAEEKKQAYEQHEKSTTEYIELLRSQGADQEKLRSLTTAQQQVLNRMYSEYQNIAGRMRMIDDAIWSKNNRLIEMERKAGTLKMEVAKN